MNLTNLYDQLEYLQHQQEKVDNDLDHIIKLLDSVKQQRNALLEERSNLYWKIEEIKDKIEEEAFK